MKQNLYAILFLICTMFVFSQCTNIEDLELGEFNAEYAIPLFNSDLSISDVISNRVDNTSLTVDENGELTLSYSGSVLTRSANDIFDFTAQFVPIAVTDTFFVVRNEDFEIPGSIEIEVLNLKSGDISFEYSSDIPEDIIVNVEIPEFVLDGESYKNTFTSTFDGDLPVTGGLFGDNLAGYQIQGGDTLLTIKYDAILPDGEKIILPTMNVFLTRLVYEYAEGFLGNDVYDIGRDTIEIDFFEGWDQGVVNFEDPKIRLTALNSFGFPLDANFFGIDVIGINGDKLSLESEAIEEGVAVDFPRFDQVGETIRTEFSFTKDNSNIIDILAVGPASIEYELDGEPNPGNDQSGRGFMTDSSRIDVQLEVELPLNGYTFGFALRDTFEVDLTSNENVKAAEFKLITESAIPLALDLQVDFVDENFNILGSINPEAGNEFIGAAPVDSDGVVNGITTKEIIDTFDEARFERIKSAKMILLRTGFRTTNSDIPQLVQFSADQSVKSRMGLKLEVAN